MNDTNEAPLVKGGQGRDAGELIDSGQWLMLLALAVVVTFVITKAVGS